VQQSVDEMGGDTAPHLSDAEVAEVLALTRDADSVELKLTLPEAHRYSSVRALGIDPLDGYLRQVFFFDTPELALDGAGVVCRARRSQGRADDSVVKLRPVVPAELDAALRELDEFGVEVDAMPGGFVCSASFKHQLGKPRVREAALGDAPIHKLFSKDQRAFFEGHVPEGVGFDSLSVLGPVNVFKLKHRAPELGRKLTVELWLYPDGSQIVELSTKCEPSEAFRVAAEARAYLSGRGVELTGDQATKTRTALEFFAGGD
jgi:hypothetical protein